MNWCLDPLFCVLIFEHWHEGALAGLVRFWVFIAANGGGFAEAGPRIALTNVTKLTFFDALDVVMRAFSSLPSGVSVRTCPRL